MADYAAVSKGNSAAGARGSSGAGVGRTGADPRRRGGANPSAAGGEPSRREIQGILAQFDAKINQMMDYPAKDVINSLTMLAERVQYAPEIVSFLETKIHRAPPNYKLPIFYLTDSILKNVRGPYVALLARNIVPLYSNCVKQVSGKDLRRFVHVLNTWDQTRLFPAEALAQMRAAANRAMEAVGEPVSSVAQPAVSFANESQPSRRAPPPPAQQQQKQQQHDMELRSLLTHMQNDMGIHPTEHLTLEQVRVQNPEWYNQLIEYHAASKQPAMETVPPVTSGLPPQQVAPPPPQQAQRPAGAGGLLTTPAGGPPAPTAAPAPPVRPAPRQPRRSRFSDVPPPGVLPHPAPHDAPPSAPQREPVKSANVAHLMDLLNRKKTTPPTPQAPQPVEITNEYTRGGTPNAAAVMSILQKLKGLNGQPAQAAPPTATQPSTVPSASSGSESSASKMWFSDKIVAHKDRVESNVQKLYAALPLVCRESGLRFKEQEKLNAHLDFLFQYNLAQKERGNGGVSRSWYPDEDQWVMDYSGEVAPREATSSSFFDRKTEAEDDTADQFEAARVPVDEGVTHCRICGENFAKSWDEEEEDWMYTNAVYGTIHHPGGAEQKTIFHKYCFDTVMANSKHITPEHLIPGTPQSLKSSGASSAGVDTSGIKRNLNEDSDDSDDEDDIKRIKRE